MSDLDIDKPHPFPDDFTALDLCVERNKALLARVAELEAKGLAVLDSWENGNYDGDLDGNMLELAEALGERDE